MRYPEESLTSEERERLAPYVTSLDGPVFALVNLSETAKGALFARYSRYGGTLRRLLLDEFAEDLPPAPAAAPADEGARAAALYSTVFLGYGDDSVAQLGGAHLACEWVSNVMTKVLQRPRLAAYLEQSTRYIAYDAPVPGGGYRYWSDPSLGPEYARAMDGLFETYRAALPRVAAWAAGRFPRVGGESDAAHARSVRAKSLDLLRGLLPAASLSHMGIYASGQAYEQLVLHLLASPLPEARHYGRLVLRELQKVIPSFLARVERPERGGRWVEYLAERRSAEERWAARMGLGDPERDAAAGPSVRLLRAHGDEDDLLAALLFEASGRGEDEVRDRVRRLDSRERVELLGALVGARENRRHRPGRGFEALRYRFEIVSDYGAFRDLQRHRMLTIQWQRLGPHLGADAPDELEEAGVAGDYRRALDSSRAEHDRLVATGRPEIAAYALCLAYRIRYVLDLDAREAMHLIELRSGREGHPSYRAVAHEMHRLIAAVHPAVAAAMTHVDRDREARLERLLSELRTEGRRDSARRSDPAHVETEVRPEIGGEVRSRPR